MGQDVVTYEDLRELLDNSSRAASLRALSCSIGAVVTLLIAKGILTEDEILEETGEVEKWFDSYVLNQAQTESSREERRFERDQVLESWSLDLDRTNGAGIVLDLKPGTAWLLYCDNGPGGPCGQSMRTTCPHSYLMTWPSEDAMRRHLKDAKWRNKKHTLMHGVVDNYTAGGVFRVVNHSDTENTRDSV